MNILILTINFAVLIDPPVILKARNLPLIENKEVEEISVWVYKNGRKVVIPFQIDEVDKKGNYLTEFVRDDGGFKKRKNGWKFGKFNGDDELVFMASDCGEKFLYRDMRDIYEVKIDMDGKTCFFYVGLGENGSRKYISYTPSSDIFSSEFFSYGSINSSNPAVLNYFLINGLGESLIKTFHLHLLISSLGGRIKFERTEDDLSAEVAGYTDGPVRLVKLMNYRMKIAKGIQSPKVLRTSIAYRACGNFPTHVDIPIKPSAFVNEAFLEMSFDFTKMVERFEMIFPDGNAISPEKLKCGEERVISDAEEILFKGMENSLLASLHIPSEITEKIVGDIIFVRKEDDFSLSWKLRGFEKLEKGSYSFTFQLCVINERVPDIKDIKISIVPLGR
jgi:hypothetical protein